MSIKYYANKVQEITLTNGTGNLVLNGSPSGFKTFVNAIGSDKKLTYYIYRQDTNFEWEIGVGYILSSGGVNQLVREKVVSSSNGNNLVSFTSGTKYVESIISEDRVNSSFINVEITGGTGFSASYAPALYLIDASTTGVQIQLPTVSATSDPIILGFVLNKTIGNQYQQSNAIVLSPQAGQNINGSGSVSVSILNDYLQLISVPSQTGWIKLDPIQDSTNPYGEDGTLQFKYGGAFSGINKLHWDNSSYSLLIGNSGVISADIILPVSGQTVVFNEQALDKDFRIEGSGTSHSHLLFIDASENKIGIDTSNAGDKLTINANNASAQGITIYKSGIGPRIVLGNTSVSGAATNGVVGTIIFSGLSSVGNSVEYGQIYSKVQTATDGAEYSSFNIDIVSNGSNEPVAVFGSGGIALGFNTSNVNGILIGDGSANDGENVTIGYYNNICGTNCVVIGNSTIVSSGTFGGSIGYDHSVSGLNTWVVGGSGIVVSGNNKLYLGIDNNNYIVINSGNAIYNSLVNGDASFTIKNAYTAPSGKKESLIFNFVNSSGIEKTGLAFGVSYDNTSNGSESSVLYSTVIANGSGYNVLNIGKEKVVVGFNNYSGNNIINGYNNTIGNTGNIIYGRDIVGSGSNNVVFGRNINYSGNNIVILGRNNDCLSSGNLNIVLVGNNNAAAEDNVVSIGQSNSSSGLYSVACGYGNGSHGSYAVSVGSLNVVQATGSVAVGKQNMISGTDLFTNIFAVGNNNYANISDTGILIGSNNELYGSGGLVFGDKSLSSGLNNIVCGFNTKVSGVNNVVIGNNAIVNENNSIIIKKDSNNYIKVSNTGVFIASSGSFNILNQANMLQNAGVSGTLTVGSGINVSGLLTSNSGVFNYLTVATGIITNLTSSTSTITSGIVTNLNVTSGVISNLTATSGVFTSLSSTYTTINQVTSPVISGVVNDWIPSVTGDVIRISGASNTGILTGISATFPLDGFILINVGSGLSGPIHIPHNSGSSAMTSRFFTLGGATVVIQPSGGSAVIIRDKVDSRWRVL